MVASANLLTFLIHPISTSTSLLSSRFLTMDEHIQFGDTLTLRTHIFRGQTPYPLYHTSSDSVTTMLLTIQANTQHFVLTSVDFIIVDSRKQHIFFSSLVSHSVVSNSFATPGTLAHQAPLSVGLSRQECWSGLPFATPRGIFPTHGLNPRLLHCRIVYCRATCPHFSHRIWNRYMLRLFDSCGYWGWVYSANTHSVNTV